MNPMRGVALRKLKVQSKMDGDLVFGSTEEQGIGIPHLFYTQLIEHTKIILKHTKQNLITGKLIQSLTETHQLESGSETQFWTLNWEKFQHTMTLTWVSETLKMFHNNRIHIDYQITTPGLKHIIQGGSVYKGQRFSDHAPLIMEYDLD